MDKSIKLRSTGRLVSTILNSAMVECGGVAKPGGEEAAVGEGEVVRGLTSKEVSREREPLRI